MNWNSRATRNLASAILVRSRQEFESGDAVTLTPVDGDKKQLEVKHEAEGRAK